MQIRLIVLGALFGIVSCANGGQMPEQTQSEKIRAGYGEPSFSERYDLAIVLPMPEVQFVEMVQAIPLPIRRIEQPELGPPFFNREIDMSVISSGYKINGGYNDVENRQELYTAYVNRSGDVAYVENSFSYAELP